MAEILLSLTIIGVVAAITLPSLTGNINERTWNTQRKALYARFSQAIALMPSLNGYGTLDDTNDTAAETFVTEGLAKVLKINNICDADHLTDCGIPDKITTTEGNLIDSFTNNHNTMAKFNNMFNGSFSHSGWGSAEDNVTSYSQSDTKAAAFETQNGESILVFYNPHCQQDYNQTNWHFIQPKICANFVYDLNGNKGPNTVGKDIGFITALYPSDSVVVSPLPIGKWKNNSVQYLQAASACMAQDAESRPPNREEAAALFCNKELLGGYNGSQHWGSMIITSSRNDTGNFWTQSLATGHQWVPENSRTVNGYLQCIKR